MFVAELSLETMELKVVARTMFVNSYLLWMMDGEVVGTVDHEMNVYIWNWKTNRWLCFNTGIPPVHDHDVSRVPQLGCRSSLFNVLQP